MAVPLKLFLRASAPLNSLKVIFDRVSEEDAVAVAARNAYSMEPSRKVWSYAGWLPRYMELFKEIKKNERTAAFAGCSLLCFQSENDELSLYEEHHQISAGATKSGGKSLSCAGRDTFTTTRRTTLICWKGFNLCRAESVLSMFKSWQMQLKNCRQQGQAFMQ